MDWAAGARGGLEVLLTLVDVSGRGVVVGLEAGSGAVRSLAGGLGFSEVEFQESLLRLFMGPFAINRIETAQEG